MRKNVKGLIGILILSAAILNGCGSGSSASTGACGNPKTCWLSSVAYGAGEFVAVGSGGEADANGEGQPWIETSTDGINWKHEDITYTGVQTYPKPILQSITYGKDGFVTTDGVHVLHSADGLNWAVDSFQSAAGKISYVIYDGTRYILYSNTTGSGGRPGPGSVFVVDNFPWQVSTDGVNWSDYGTITVTNGPAGEPVSIIHEAGMYEAVWQPAASVTSSTRYLTATSPDGLSWTLGTPVAVPVSGAPTIMMYDILHTGDQYLLFGGVDETDDGTGSWGVAFHGSSISAMTMVGPLTANTGGDFPAGEFYPAGEPLHGDFYDVSGLVSNGTVTVGLGIPGLLVTTDGITWNYESMDGVVPDTECAGYHQPNSCTGFASAAAAPGGPIVVLVSDGSAGAETTDGVHWVKSNL